MNNLIRNSESLGSQKGLTIQKVGSLLYKGCRDISERGSQKVIESLVFIPFSFVGDSTNISLVRRSGDNVLLLTIR